MKQNACKWLILKMLGKLEERGGFEPPLPFGNHAFQACALSHSAISPTILLQWRSQATRAMFFENGRGGKVPTDESPRTPTPVPAPRRQLSKDFPNKEAFESFPNSSLEREQCMLKWSDKTLGSTSTNFFKASISPVISS